MYDNHQEAHFAADALGVPTFSTRNAGRATINGADIDVTAVPTATDQIRGMVEYLRAHYDSFSYDAYAPLTPPSSTGCRYTLINPLTANLDCSGFQVSRSPEWSASLSYQHTFSLPGGNALTPMLSAQYIASRWLAIDFTSNEHAPSAVTADASLLFTPAQGKWSVTAFVRNMTNRAVYTGAVQNFFIPDLIAGTLDPPRTYGARFNYRY